MSPQRISGACFFAGGPATGQPVTLLVSPDAVTLEQEDGRVRAIDAAMLTLSLGGFDNRSVVMTLPLPEGGVAELHIREPDTIARIISSAPPTLAQAARQLAGHSQHMRRSQRWTALATIVLSLLMAVGVWYGATLAAGGAIRLVPASAEAQLGKLVAGSLVGGRRVLSSGPAYEAVQKTLDRVLAGAGEIPYSFNVQLVDAPEVNAVAAPGGSVVVYTGLLREISGPEELAGVLGHEVQHVLQRHGLRQLAGQIGLSAVLSLVAGDLAGLAGMAAQLASLSYSRTAEEEADAGAVTLLQRAHIDPSGLTRFFARQSQKMEPPALLSTHPSSNDRQDRLKALIQSQPDQGPYAPMGIDWAAVQTALGGATTPSP